MRYTWYPQDRTNERATGFGGVIGFDLGSPSPKEKLLDRSHGPINFSDSSEERGVARLPKSEEFDVDRRNDETGAAGLHVGIMSTELVSIYVGSCMEYDG